MNLILGNKALECLEIVDGDIQYNDKVIKVEKSNRNRDIKVTVDDKLLYERKCELSYHEHDDEVSKVTEKLYVMDGCFECIHHHNSTSSFRKDNYIYYDDGVACEYISGTLNATYKMDSKLEQFIYQCYYHNVVYYEINTGDIYIDYIGRHKLDLNLDIERQLFNILNSVKENSEEVKNKVKLYISKLFEENNLNASYLVRKYNGESICDQFETAIDKQIETSYISSKKIPELVWSIQNIKMVYEQYVDYKTMQSDIAQEIINLNNMFEYYYDLHFNVKKIYEDKVATLKKQYHNV